MEKVMVWAIIGEKTGAVIRTDHGTQAEMDKAAEFWKPHFCYVRQLVLAEALTQPATSGEVTPSLDRAVEAALDAKPFSDSHNNGIRVWQLIDEYSECTEVMRAAILAALPHL
ncbi:hypothetical protein CSC64_06805 [Pseudoxanthomonas koreensis]|nr:hypothetical protein CSC64_06805 [Pseudoxanthomonas koreensis]